MYTTSGLYYLVSFVKQVFASAVVLLLGVWNGLRFVIVAFPGLFSYPFLLSLSLYVFACLDW